MTYNGLKIPRFVPRSRRTLLSARVANEILGPLNALLTVRIVRGNEDKVEITDAGTLITLKQTGETEGYWNEEQSYTATCPAGSNGTDVSVTVAAETVGSKVSQTDANDMALELATSRAIADLVCETTTHTYPNGIVTQIKSDGTLFYVSGQFTTMGGKRRNGFAVLESTLAADASDWWISASDGTYASASDEPSTVGLKSDGSIYHTGKFAKVNGLSRAKAVLLDDDGTVIAGFDPGTGPNDLVYDAIVDSAGKPVLVGAFTSCNGTTRGRIVRLTTLGAVDTGFDPGSGANGTILGICSDGSTGYYIVGGFSSYNGTSSNGAARVNSDGSHATGFNPAAKLSSGGRSVARQSDGKIVIVGGTLDYDGATHTGIVRLNSDGTCDTGFTPQFATTGASGMWVQCVAIQSDGKIVCGGYFDTINSATRNGICRLNTDGTLDTTFTANTALSGDVNGGKVNSLVIESSGNIVFGGVFDHVNGTARTNLARVGPTGTLLG